MAFGLKYYAELRSKFKSVFWRVEIHQRDYSGTAERMEFDGDSPIKITWEQRGSEFFIPVKGSEATVNILCLQNFKYINLFTSDPRKFRVSIFRNTKLYWRGYVVADLYSETFSAPPYQVSIKAVDGFNLLSGIKFKNSDGANFPGKRSLWSLISDCINLLELGISIADWMDLYADGMSLTSSPLQQTYLDMDRFYMVYEDPSYRDILELCLQPFAAQIFQSNGALHIRRAISLYQSTRPVSFYDVGSEFPTGWISTSDGRTIITQTGAPIITEATRERIESIWEDDINISGESTLDIVPAVRKIIVNVEDKSHPNIVNMLGWMNIEKWNDPHSCLFPYSSDCFQLRGYTEYINHILTSPGYDVSQSAYTVNLAMTLVAGYTYYGSSSSSRPGSHTHKIKFALVLTNANATYYLSDNGGWATVETWLEYEITTTNEESVKIDIIGFPIDGILFFKIQNTMRGTPPNPRGEGNRPGFIPTIEIEWCSFKQMTLTIDAGTDFENAIKSEVMINPANNVDMEISLPIADVPILPNDSLVFSLYLTDSTGKPTRMWRTKGRNDYDTLVNHLILSAMRYKQRSSRRIGGEMFTGKHIDMNTVAQDDKFLKTGFYVNSIDLDSVEDSFDVELIEMPDLLVSQSPPIGDDCMKISEFLAVPKTILKLGNQIIALSASRVYAYDVIAGTMQTICTVTNTAKLFPADNAFVILQGKKVTVYDHRCVVIKSYTDTSSYEIVFATMIDGYIYLANSLPKTEFLDEHIEFHRPGYPYKPSVVAETNSVLVFGKYKGGVVSHSTIGIQTDLWSCFFDKRIHISITGVREERVEFVTVSDYYIGLNTAGSCKIYKRVTASEKTLIKTIAGNVDLADHTVGELAYVQNNVIKRWAYNTNYNLVVKNLEGSGLPVNGLCYINGELYIVRNKTIYKYAI